MFGIGRKKDKKMLLQAHAIEAAARNLHDDLRTLQRAVELAKNNDRVADILYVFIDSCDEAMGDPDERIDETEWKRRVRAADEARNRALGDLHAWFCDQVRAILPDNVDPADTGRIVAALVGMPFVEETHADH